MPNFSLYGPTPSSASAQQLPWAGYYTDQNNVNERNRVSAIIASLQLQEQQDRQDEAARQFDQGRNIDLTRYAHRIGEGRRGEAEELRRFNLNLDWKRGAAAEDRRQFDAGLEFKRVGRDADLTAYEQAKTEKLQDAILGNKFKSLAEIESLGVVTPKNAGNILKWYRQALADKVDGQVEELNARTAQAQANQFADVLTQMRQLDPSASLLPAKRKTALAIMPDTADLIARSVGKLEPGVRWDNDAQEWTEKEAVSRGFSPVMGRVREAENESSRVNFRNLSKSPPATEYSGGLPAGDELVRVFNPAGQAVRIKKSALTDALAKGYRLR